MELLFDCKFSGYGHIMFSNLAAHLAVRCRG
jgi:hypothetical protein